MGARICGDAAAGEDLAYPPLLSFRSLVPSVVRDGDIGRTTSGCVWPRGCTLTSRATCSFKFGGSSGSAGAHPLHVATLNNHAAGRVGTSLIVAAVFGNEQAVKLCSPLALIPWLKMKSTVKPRSCLRPCQGTRGSPRCFCPVTSMSTIAARASWRVRLCTTRQAMDSLRCRFLVSRGADMGRQR